MADVKLSAEIRQEIGKNRSNQLRHEDYLPGIIYGKGKETKAIKVRKPDFEKLVRKHGYSSLIELEVEGETSPAIIKEVQNHPVKGTFLHVDFQLLNMDEKIKLTLPITIVGRENAESAETILIQQLNEIDIECLPGNIPQSIVADVSNVDLNTPFFVEDLEIFKDDSITIFRDPQDVIASLTVPTVQVEEDEDEDEELPEVEVIGEEKEEEVESEE